MASKIVRINEELAKEIERIAKENKIKFIEASKDVTELIKKNRNKKIIREIQF